MFSENRSRSNSFAADLANFARLAAFELCQLLSFCVLRYFQKWSQPLWMGCMSFTLFSILITTRLLKRDEH